MSVETVTVNDKAIDETQISSLYGRQSGSDDQDEDEETQTQTLQLPNVEISIELSNVLHQTERKVYSIFTMIGDIGGFNGAIIILPSYILTSYSARMYSSSI